MAESEPTEVTNKGAAHVENIENNHEEDQVENTKGSDDTSFPEDEHKDAETVSTPLEATVDSDLNNEVKDTEYIDEGTSGADVDQSESTKEAVDSNLDNNDDADVDTSNLQNETETKDDKGDVTETEMETEESNAELQDLSGGVNTPVGNTDINNEAGDSIPESSEGLDTGDKVSDSNSGLTSADYVGDNVDNDVGDDVCDDEQSKDSVGDNDVNLDLNKEEADTGSENIDTVGEPVGDSVNADVVDNSKDTGGDEDDVDPDLNEGLGEHNDTDDVEMIDNVEDKDDLDSEEPCMNTESEANVASDNINTGEVNDSSNHSDSIDNSAAADEPSADKPDINEQTIDEEKATNVDTSEMIQDLDAVNEDSNSQEEQSTDPLSNNQERTQSEQIQTNSNESEQKDNNEVVAVDEGTPSQSPEDVVDITNDGAEMSETEPKSNAESEHETNDSNSGLDQDETISNDKTDIQSEDVVTDKDTEVSQESVDKAEAVGDESSVIEDSVDSVDCSLTIGGITAVESLQTGTTDDNDNQNSDVMEVAGVVNDSPGDNNADKESTESELQTDNSVIKSSTEEPMEDILESQTKEDIDGIDNNENDSVTENEVIDVDKDKTDEAVTNITAVSEPQVKDTPGVPAEPADSNNVAGEDNKTSDMTGADNKSGDDGMEVMDTEDVVEVSEQEKMKTETSAGKTDINSEESQVTPLKPVFDLDTSDTMSTESMDIHEGTPTKKKQEESVNGEAMDVTDDSNKMDEPAAGNDAQMQRQVKKEIIEKQDTTSELKIIGVTSAVNKVNETNHASTDSAGLQLKIDSVTGTTDAKPKVETKMEESKPVTVKKEKIEQLTNEKKEQVTTDKKDSLKVPETDTKKNIAADDDDDVIAIKEEKKLPPPKPKSSKIQKCIVCAKVGKCKYNIVRNGDVKHLCDDKCFKQFRSDPTSFLKQAEKEKNLQEAAVKNGAKEPLKPASTNLKNVLASKIKGPGGDSYKTCAVCQLMNVKTSKPFLNWQGLDYCGEECLGKFQSNLSVNCSLCSTHIALANKAKFCARIGSEVKHFCSQLCNTDFVKRIKVCAYCNKDLAKENDSFMAPVGNQGMFKDFCSQTCLQKYEDKNTKDVEVTGELLQGTKTAVAPSGNFTCAVCSKSGPIKHELKLDKKVHRLCSDPCFSAFQYANKLTLNCCDGCGTPCTQNNDEMHFVQFEGKQKRFCSFMCVNQFRNTKRKLVPCAWCSTKKSNFDMIERVDSSNRFQLFCSLNCLSLYRVNLQATSNQAVICDQCQKCVPAQYHLTMSDASVRNFCSYGCVMQFQAQFQTPSAQKQPTQNYAQKQQQVQTTPPPQQQVTTRSGRVVKGGAKQQQYVDLQQQQQQKKEINKQIKTTNQDAFPIISNVVSLAPKGTQQQINIRSVGGVTVTDQQSGKTITTSTGNQTVQQQIIIQPPPPKSVKNKSLLCKPFVQTKATACRPHTQTKEVQTVGKPEPDKIFVPVPVPIYCPTPLSMYTMPAPILVPVPVPIPVPVFIPTTKKNSASILKQIKEIQEKIPADPLEAELLMMAEAVAGKGEDSSSDSDEGEQEASVTKDITPAASGGELGEDMLQMALRMASEMSDEPVMDLETSLEPVAVNTEPPQPPPPPPPVVKEESDDDEEYVPTTRSTRRGRGASKRQTKATPRRSSKRQKTEPIPQPVYHTPTPSPPPAPQAPPPDVNFHLKYTYGVNAFKYWVTQKNSQLEDAGKSGHTRSLKTFKTDILQCTADELNYALCLFVKEVRKPNSEEYAVDSIYYLCLGIQQYLFENGRIDNVFTDIYYERFTECLNELLCRYEPKLNHAGQLVCRIEEEHLWESKQLGAHSPHVLLNTLVYFNTKYFMLKMSEDHLKLSFTHIMKHWKKTASGRGSGVGVNQGRSVYLRYYCPTPQSKDNASKKKKEEMPVYEQTENLDNPLRCPVKLYEFYLSKCPESIKNRNDTFYLVPERSCVPDSPVWYSTAMLGVDAMAKMLNRIRLVREIQEAHLHTQPVYI